MKDAESERRSRALQRFLPHERAKLERSDFPPHIPDHVVDRILEADSQRYRWTPWEVAALVAFSATAIGLFVGTKMVGWPLWVPIAFATGMGALTPVLRRLEGRRIQKVMIQQGLTCPSCRQPMFTNTWSLKEQDAQREAMMQGRCPRCFAQVESLSAGES